MLKIYYSIDGAYFMYNKKSDSEYVAEGELIFQVIDKEGEVEVNRQRLGLNFSKDSFQKIKLNNLKEGQVEFSLDSKSHIVHIQLIDLESKSYWTKRINIDEEAIQSSLSNLHIYYENDLGESLHVVDEVKGVTKFNCQFHYIHKDKQIEKLNLVLFNLNDTIFYHEVPISPDNNEYDIQVDVPDDISGKIKFQISDGVQKREKIISLYNLINKDFWLNNIKMVRGVMRYVLPIDVYRKIKKMKDEEALNFLQYYWSKLDPDKETESNELLDELNSRVQHVNLEFKELSREGWRTDRGKIFIVHGKPESSTTEYNPSTNVNRLIWSYDSGKVFIFEDRGSFGHYYLINQGF